MDLKNLRSRIDEFCSEREWQQFHSPKNLAMSVAVEAGELLEIFMWLTEQQSASLSEEQCEAVADEVGDVLICLVNLASKLGIDPVKAAEVKLLKNAVKYPVDKARGSAKKYDQL